MEVIETQPEIDYVKIGQRIRAARLEKGYSQADLGALVGCSNNHMSHVEVGQTKVSLAMLLKLAFVLEKNFTIFYWIPHMQNATASLIMRLLQN